MVLSRIWTAFFFIAFIVAAVRFVVSGDVTVFQSIIDSTFSSSRTAFEISLGLTGVLSLWLGIMKIGERGGLIDALARLLSPVFVRLFPEIPKGHPVMGSIFMNISANMLGLDNAATPLGLKAMQGLQELNNKKDTASNAMIMFLVLNTSGLTLLPVSIMVYRAQLGAAAPTDVFLPILLATFFSTLAGIVVTALFQRINLFSRPLLLTIGGLCLVVSLIVWGMSSLSRAAMDSVGAGVSSCLLFLVIIGFLLSGVRRKINVYDAFIDGAKEGFQTAVRIIPYLVAILVGVGVFRASGAMDWITDGITWVFSSLSLPSEWTPALPTALMKPLSGSGARGLMVDCMTSCGVDSLPGRLSCVFQGSTDTTFYILAVYFGSVGVRFSRHAVTCGLLADFCGLVAAVCVCYFFFA